MSLKLISLRPGRAAREVWSRFSRMVSMHPVTAAATLAGLYLLTLQREYLITGDVWAETHMEYLSDALKERYPAVFQPGWAGYLTLLPSLIVKSYVYFGLPLGYIDYFYRAVGVIFIIACIAACAGQAMKGLLANVWLRLGFCLAILLLLRDIGILSFINVWYLGFVPIILLAVSAERLKPGGQIIYAVFGVLIALTKPPVMLLPFVIYRMVKTREWISGGFVAAAIITQTVIMLTLDPRGSGATASRDLWLIIQAVFTGGAVELLKLVQVVPTSLAVILAVNLLLAGILALAWRRFGLIRCGLVVFGYAFAVYSYVLAPDAPIFTDIKSYQQIYFFNFKTQREFLIQFFILLGLTMAAGGLAPTALRLQGRRKVLAAGAAGLAAAVLLVRLYTPADMESAGVAANIGPFRHALNTGQSACMPIPPTPRFAEHANWQYEFNSACYPRNFQLSPEFGRMKTRLERGLDFTIPNDTPYPLKTVYVAVRNSTPQAAASFKLIEKTSGVEYIGSIPARRVETLNFIPVNVAGLPLRNSYEFEISAETPHLMWGKFKEQDKYIYYPYFGDTRIPTKRPL